MGGRLLWVCVLLLPLDAWGWQHRTCNGQPIQWRQNRADIDIDMCSVPAGHRRSDAVWYALSEWNSIGGMPGVFAVGQQASCGVRHGDGHSTIAYVAPEHVDGSLGVTRRYYTRGCWRWAFDLGIAETDVMLSTALDTRIAGRAPLANLEPNPACERATRPRATERATILHELGHALGLDHEDDHMAMMMTRSGEGRFCGPRPFSPHPDDVAGARRLYGDGQQVLDMAASPWQWVAPDRIGEVHPVNGAGALPSPVGCSGALLDVQYSVANLGNRDGAYRLWWFASRDDRVSGDDRLLHVTAPKAIGAEAFVTRRTTLRMSRHIEADVDYHLGYIVEPMNDWQRERRQGNNTAFLRAPIRRRGEVHCP